MSLQLMCPNLRCRKVLLVPEAARGKVVKCQHCNTILKVPETRESPPPAPAPPK